MPDGKDLKLALGALLERKHCTEVTITLSAEEARGLHVVLALSSKGFGIDIDARSVVGKITYIPPSG